MIHEVHKFQVPGGEATITTYIKDVYSADQDSFSRPLIVIFPGGGYHHLSVREAEPIALKMLDMGMDAIVVRYSLSPVRFPAQLLEAAYAMKYVRDHAVEWDVNTDKIIVMGFSAGAHVAASIGTMWNDSILDDYLEKELGCSHEYIKPNGMCLGYPVITSGEMGHRGSFENLLGDEKKEYLEKVSLEKQVTKDTPEAFIWHTFEDQTVPLENSLLFAEALRKCDIPFEYHVFPKGQHGLALGTAETASKGGKHYEPSVAPWVSLFGSWVEK